jgi:hypothetical protein
VTEELQTTLSVGLAALVANLPYVAVYIWALYMARRSRNTHPGRARFVTIGVALLLAATILGPLQTAASSYAFQAETPPLDIGRATFIAQLVNYALNVVGTIFVIRAVFLTEHTPPNNSLERSREG